jgi:hypothetical protein
MKHLAVVAVALALGSAGCTKSTTAPSTTPTKPTFTADLRPSNEVPPVTNAESTGSGTATITFDTTQDSAGNITSATVTFVVNLQGFPAGTPFNIAHIHEGPSTCACPVAVNTTLTASEGLTAINGAASFTKAGIRVADPALAQRIINSPGSFYFNVHSTLNPGGAARGQLVKVQ